MVIIYRFSNRNHKNIKCKNFTFFFLFREKKHKEIVEIPEISEKKDDPIVYNSVSSCQKPINWGAFMYYNECFGSEVPSEKILWYYSFMLNRYLWLHNICCFFLHTIPGAIVDFLAFLTGHEPM